MDHIYPSELQLNKANSSDTDAFFFDYLMVLYLVVQFQPKFMINGTILILIYTKGKKIRYTKFKFIFQRIFETFQCQPKESFTTR